MAASIKRLFACILFFLLPSLLLAQAIPSLDEILKSVGDSIQTFEDNLPDFECRETVIQRTSKKGKMKEETIESIFRSFAKPQQWKGKPTTEAREFLSINGRQIAQDGKKSGKDPAVYFWGIFRGLLGMTFALNCQSLHKYEIVGVEIKQGRRILELAFRTIEGQNSLGFMINKKNLACKDVGKAWLNLDSMQVIRIERKFLNVPKKMNPILISVDYSKVDLAGREFWMPTSVQTTASEKNGAGVAVFFANYADYHKYDVSTKITYGAVVQQ
jgi:hypothetical protein